METETREILEGLAKKLDSDTCTPLEIFNIKMYAALLGGLGGNDIIKDLDK